MGRFRQALYIRGQSATLYRWHKTGPQTVRHYSRDEAGIKQLTEDILGHTAAATYLLLDLLEEEYHLGNVPHVSTYSQDHRLVLARYGERVMRNSPFRLVQLQGRETQGRRDDKVLCAGVANGELIDFWLKPLLAKKVSVAGITSVPLLSHELLRQITKAQGQHLLVTKTKEYLRLTYFSNGQLKLSRLAAVRGDNSHAVMEAIEKEVDKTQLYLGRMRLTVPDKPLAIWMTVEAKHETVAQERQAARGAQGWQLASLAKLAAQLKLPWREEDDCEVLFVALSLMRKSVNHYATPAHLQFERWQRNNIALQKSSAGLLGGAVLACILGATNIFNLADEQKQLEAQTTLNARRVASIESGVTKTAVEPDDIRAAVNTIDKLDELQRMPIVLVKPVSAVLAKFSDLVVDRVKWRLVTPDVVALQIDPAVGPVDGSGELDAEGKFPVREVLEITGHVTGVSDDYVRAVDRVTGFVEALKATKQFSSAKAIKTPLPLTASSLLEGSSGSGQEPAPANFTIEVELESRHAS